MKNWSKVGVHETSRGPYISTYSKKKFYPLDIRKSDLDIIDIAHALSNMCRFAGHVDKFFSVAEHSVRVSKIIDKDLALAGLLHYASEAYLVDVPRPLKQLVDFGPYRKIEKKVQDTIYRKYNIHLDIDDLDRIHIADNLQLAVEARDLMGNPYWCHVMGKAEGKITKTWAPEKAEKEFLKRFKELTK